MLGGTLGNFNQAQQNHILHKIYKSANKGDIFIITFDTTLSEHEVLFAYAHEYNYIFFKRVLEYFVIFNPAFKNRLDAFDVECS
jgi:uncharacterized SAM-dependent methyltransferase